MEFGIYNLKNIATKKLLHFVCPMLTGDYVGFLGILYMRSKYPSKSRQPRSKIYSSCS